MCGGTQHHYQDYRYYHGLSPRVRGNRWQQLYRGTQGRSIPACAGEPGRGDDRPAQHEVYPRVCGGTNATEGLVGTPAGLSPRVRGNRSSAPAGVMLMRSIPACAGEPGALPEGLPLHQVYPRVCGGTRQPQSQHRTTRGLSPRVRGNPAHRPLRATGRRSIPACAGEPVKIAVAPRPGEVYPRVCGGTPDGPEHYDGTSGLSPRVRGNLRATEEMLPCRGSIPACAGEPAAHLIGPGLRGVYPRVCGGTPPPPYSEPSAGGLSPRVRGNPANGIYAVGTIRSIPACAGEPYWLCVGQFVRAVYPRVCGGTPGALHWLTLGQGLSPRVRGNRTCACPAGRTARSIPACAGEPSGISVTCGMAAVYPRVCGGTARGIAVEDNDVGLSPRVRGNRTFRLWRAPGWRSIPACAREPPVHTPAQCPAVVYPRVCGGTASARFRDAYRHGLSPRVRGNPLSRGCRPGLLRSIPACAGEPQSIIPATGLRQVYPRVCGGTNGCSRGHGQK